MYLDYARLLGVVLSSYIGFHTQTGVHYLFAHQVHFSSGSCEQEFRDCSEVIGIYWETESVSKWAWKATQEVKLLGLETGMT